MNKSRKTQIESCKARGNIYGLLARVFRVEPDTEFLKDIKSSQIDQIFTSLDIDFGTDFYQQKDGKLEADLAIEFTRLFLGPGSHISPHESIFVEVDGDTGNLWGKGTVAVKKFIESTGLVYDDDFSGMPDHISVELEFMQKLTDWEVKLWEQGEEEHALHCRSLQKMFSEKHLLKWVPEFCLKVEEKAELPFFREMAKLTSEFVEFDAKTIETT